MQFSLTHKKNEEEEQIYVISFNNCDYECFFFSN